MPIQKSPKISRVFRSWILNKRLLITKFLRSELGSDISWLYLIHFLNYLVPLLLIPFLARVLGASGWGSLAFALAFTSFVYLITECGFYVSAQREAARFQHDIHALNRLFNDVLSAKLVVALLVVTVSLIASRFVPILHQDLRLFLGVLFLGIIQAFNLTWYFRGIQRIKLAAGMEVVAKGLSAILVVIVITSPADFWKYFYAFGVSQLVVLIWAFWYVSKTIRLCIPTFSGGVRALRGGGFIFLLHSIGSVFTASNVFLLGLLAPPQIVGYFAGSERIVRFLASVMDPVRHAMFPRLSFLVTENRQEARRQVKLILAITGIFGIVLGGLVYLFAPILVSIIFGSDFLPAIDSLRFLALLIPILTLNAGLGFLWMLPRGFERACIIILFSALLINIVLALLFVPLWQHIGMAISLVASELFIVICFFIFFKKDKDEQSRSTTHH